MCVEYKYLSKRSNSRFMSPDPINKEHIHNGQKSIPSKELLGVVVQVFEALGDETRTKILYAIRRQEMSVRDLSILIDVSESAISHQLKYLKTRHLVKSRRDGNVIYYKLSFRHLSALLREAEYYADHLKSKLPDHPYREDE